MYCLKQRSDKIFRFTQIAYYSAGGIAAGLGALTQTYRHVFFVIFLTVSGTYVVVSMATLLWRRFSRCPMHSQSSASPSGPTSSPPKRGTHPCLVPVGGKPTLITSEAKEIPKEEANHKLEAIAEGARPFGNASA